MTCDRVRFTPKRTPPIRFRDYAPCSAARRRSQTMNIDRFPRGFNMARNTVQFQKGLSEPEFERQYGTEAQCRAAVVAFRWPNGFECPVCGGKQHSVVKSRNLYQCTACRRQTSPIAGTIFESTKRRGQSRRSCPCSLRLASKVSICRCYHWLCRFYKSTRHP